MKLKEYIGDQNVEKLKRVLEEALESEEGVFIIIGTPEKTTDVYMGICVDCLIKKVSITIMDAERKGLLAHGKEDFHFNPN